MVNGTFLPARNQENIAGSLRHERRFLPRRKMGDFRQPIDLALFSPLARALLHG
jgi:hypothetical protein